MKSQTSRKKNACCCERPSAPPALVGCCARVAFQASAPVQQARASPGLPTPVWRRAGLHRASHVRDVPLAHGQAAAAVRWAGAAARRDRGCAAGAAVDDPGAACGVRPRARARTPRSPCEARCLRAAQAKPSPGLWSHTMTGMSAEPGSSARAAARGARAAFCCRRHRTLTL